MLENIDLNLGSTHTEKKLAPNKPDHKKFQAMLNEYSPDKSVTEAEAQEAYRNLGEFVNVLLLINEREKIVKTEDP